MWEGKGEDGQAQQPSQEDEGGDDDDDFGDDFDEFAEEGDDFGDFDEADETPLASEQAPTPAPHPPPPDVLGDLVSSIIKKHVSFATDSPLSLLSTSRPAPQPPKSKQQSSPTSQPSSASQRHYHPNPSSRP